MLTKKEFKKVVEILRDCPNEEDRKEAFTEEEIKSFEMYQKNLIDLFSKWFRSENPQFDEVKFKDMKGGIKNNGTRTRI